MLAPIYDLGMKLEFETCSIGQCIKVDIEVNTSAGQTILIYNKQLWWCILANLFSKKEETNKGSVHKQLTCKCIGK